ncbi:helix-turn-helix domain-containing protein [Francisella philomiragia]|uniref:helix-turn-helix domain-containing protein n=1 Tax=Francisella philomiragia TaxID=28110 RepID=UPI0019088290|nr:helix-turn-helix transcriptional regulator [Francisella philomiragia]MBK2270219.1 helix-turn-helix transcriptional regulator [Francisella philomiragia]MBK2275883.1 helix-turn-helix transcriptional regulator [Francisella philomiragia]MBK2305097.1 helix-turn-helix transcriptional regulator [Francisella philomiragia]
MNWLAYNLKSYMDDNNLGQREFGKIIQLSHSTLSRLLNKDDQKVQPNTKRKISNFFGFSFDEITSNKLSDLQLNKKSHKVQFIDFNGNSTKENIETNEEYSFAINVKDNNYAPLFPKGSILFFSKEPAYQLDICIVKNKNKLSLCSIKESYRLELKVVNLATDEKYSILRDSVIAVLMKSLNPN